MSDNKDKKEERAKLNFEIGKRFKVAREEAGLTQQQLSNLLEVNSQYISDVERGLVGLSILSIIKISEILNVTTDYIIKGTKNDNCEYNLQLGNRSIYLSKDEYSLMEQTINTMIRAFKIHKKVK